MFGIVSPSKSAASTLPARSSVTVWSPLTASLAVTDTVIKVSSASLPASGVTDRFTVGTVVVSSWMISMALTSGLFLFGS